MAIKELKMAIKEDGAVQKIFEFSATAAEMKQLAKETAAELSNYVAIPGFRKGKAPAGMVIKRYEADVKNEALRKLIAVAFDQLEADKSLDILNCTLAEPPKAFDLDKDFSFSLKVVPAPEIALPDYKAIKVDAPAVEVTDEQLEERVKYYCGMYGNYAEVEGPAVADDMLKVSYTSDFKPAEDASAGLLRTVNSDDNYLWLNEPEYIPGSIAALTGAEIGKEYSFAATFPADWRDAELAGQTVNYTVKVNGIQRRTPVSVDELCEKMQVKTIEEVKQLFRDNGLREAEIKRHGEIVEKAFAELDSKVAEFELPADALEAEVEKELRVMINQDVKNEEDAEKFRADMENHRAKAKEAAQGKLRKKLILRKIALNEDIDVSNQELDAQISMMARYYGYKENDFRKMIERNGSIEDLRADILSNKVLDQLAKFADAKAE